MREKAVCVKFSEASWILHPPLEFGMCFHILERTPRH
jgi:hypothetical protein